MTRWTWLLGAVGVVGLTLSLGPPHPRSQPDAVVAPSQNDVALYTAIVTHVTEGEPYYASVRRELMARDYPTGNVAGWRTPLYLELVARVPLLLRVGMILVGVLVLLGTADTLRTLSPQAWIVGLVMQIGIVAALWQPEMLVMPEPLAGGLIALSVLLALKQWRWTSVGLGIAALCIRELAVPYVGIRLLLSLSRREWRESFGWGLGLCGYGMYLLWHVQQVHLAMPAHPTWHVQPWIQFGGLRFVIATVRSNAWLTLAPWWIAPAAFVALLLGLWRAPALISLSVLGYVLAFSIVGQPFNWYWGWIPGMLSPLAWAYALPRSVNRNPRLQGAGPRMVDHPLEGPVVLQPLRYDQPGPVLIHHPH